MIADTVVIIIALFLGIAAIGAIIFQIGRTVYVKIKHPNYQTTSDGTVCNKPTCQDD